MDDTINAADLLGPATLRAYSALARFADDTAQAYARYMTPAPETEPKFSLRGERIPTIGEIFSEIISEPPRRSSLPPFRIICDSPWLSITIGKADGGQ
ncbi:hypothetical protein [Methylocystis sp. SB2]|uniref:hypothetical protein n=1 Tax=Methylocystis sp. (strain SB2) TaxID=743836 RepID=UPI000411DBF8|nr:hypothetical protein [Methylocystis sp. SB2]ULO24253.1 hypothetical protein LNB28_02245 [Methylocystis sp. SB2]